MYRFKTNSKYKNKKVKVDNIVFDSIKESNRYKELKYLENAGLIKELVLQPKYELQPKFKYEGKTVRKIEYIADFKYIDIKTNKEVVEDVKGIKTEVYRLKKKMMLYKYNIDVKEI